jgi:hypothetical protein
VLVALAGVALVRTGLIQRLVTPVPLQPIDEALDEVTTRNIEDKAPGFRHRYAELVKRLDRSNFRLIAWILMHHGREYSLAHIEPFLQSETGDTRLLVAVYLYTSSARLHPDAKDVLLSAEQGDEFVQAALIETDSFAAKRRDSIRRKCGLSVVQWGQMTDAEKWRAWRKCFSTRFGDTSMN